MTLWVITSLTDTFWSKTTAQSKWEALASFADSTANGLAINLLIHSIEARIRFVLKAAASPRFLVGTEHCSNSREEIHSTFIDILSTAWHDSRRSLWEIEIEFLAKNASKRRDFYRRLVGTSVDKDDKQGWVLSWVIPAEKKWKSTASHLLVPLQLNRSTQFIGVTDTDAATKQFVNSI